jgi:hypothetical protein
MSVTVELKSAIYPPECLREAITAYRGICSVRIIHELPAEISVEISRFSDLIDEGQLTNEFLNYLLDLSLEKHLAEFESNNGTD